MKKGITLVLGITGCISLLAGIVLKIRKTSFISMSIIGGADGPTSVWVAGKVGSDFPMVLIGIGVVLLVILAGYIWKRKKKE